MQSVEKMLSVGRMHCATLGACPSVIQVPICHDPVMCVKTGELPDMTHNQQNITYKKLQAIYLMLYKR